ncbi:MAG: hypothetical protein CVV64_01380 [Candidatus Wallbacteria bacterium HGW-Wallbacteria-1]|jgi:tetratricopeptide (TPR) repeat protein|uniref:Tetratricopeptide repeat protein n=1 Tax=Candidatus Wallbacteria bacterium HGW-Wallbacteria-1 TaxID=2013854 RepID=A0A2N1PUV8_9BACT|nr:MAG: hypothetical protein CVV64_01380 [Candidatus Wallbacteria bacterium HGW-Wallbacteria-1]
MRKHLYLLLLLLPLLAAIGCGNGGGVGNDESIGSVSANINDGWDSLEAGNFDNAVTKFTNALSFAEDNSLKTSAKTGLAWSYAKKGDLTNAISTFEDVKNLNNDANIGLAGAYLARGNPEDFEKAIQLLEHIESYGGGLTTYSSVHTGVSNAEAYAILAYCHYLNGNEEKAKLNIKTAAQLDPNNDSVKNITETLEILGLTIPK